MTDHLRNASDATVRDSVRRPRGIVKLELFKGGKKTDEDRFEDPFFNAITDQGHASFLSWFNNIQGPASPYMGLIDDAGTTTLPATATYAVPVFTEFINYTVAAASNRAEWVNGAVVAGPPATIDNSASVATFDIVAPGGDVFGIFVAYSLSGDALLDDLGNTSAADGILWAQAAFPGGAVTVADTDQLKVTYTISC